MANARVVAIEPTGSVWTYEGICKDLLYFPQDYLNPLKRDGRICFIFYETL
jgi:hypothetical protein